MEARSRVAAAAAAVVPFHCVICFDEFNLKDRPPMVLPCGHTYVCLPCSKRLRRCMECREPLFVPMNGAQQHSQHQQQTQQQQQQWRPTTPNRLESSGSGNGLYSNRGSTFQRYGGANSPPQQQVAPSTPPHGSFNHYQNYPHHPQQHPSPPVTMPLPIPKNVVLISMIEAAERQAKVVENEMRELQEFQDQIREEQGSTGDDNSNKAEEENRQDTTTNASAHAEEDEEEEDQFDLNRIISGMATMSGPCGTYGVREATGLTVIPTDPRKRMAARQECEEKKENASDDESEKECPHDEQLSDAGQQLADLMIEPFALDEGQTVQVVSFEDGVAKLARGAGFIIANSSQLVKVGGPLDETCRLEGLLETVEGRGNDLKRELETSHAIEENLKRQIQKAMESEPTHPIVTDPPMPVDTFLSASHSDSVDTPLPSTPPSADKSHLETPETAESAGFMIENRPPSNVLPTDLLSFLPQQRRGLPGSPVSIDNADINLPRYRRSNSNDDLSSLAGLGCGTTFLGEASSSIFGAAAEITFNDENHGHHHRHHDDDDQNVEEDSVLGDGGSLFGGIGGRTRSDSHESSPGASHFGGYYYVAPGTPTQTASFDGVDFRTGLSGHRALNRTHSHRHTHHHYGGSYNNSSSNRRHGRFMMSEHRGIGRIRPLRRSSPATTSASQSFDPRFMPVQEKSSTGSC